MKKIFKMIKKILKYSILISICVLFCGCRQTSRAENQSEIAVSNSYLLSVVKDILPEQTNILCLNPPGMCPGHFDISPVQVNQLGQCRSLLIFDFQHRINDALVRFKERGLKIYTIECPAGLCLPQTYLSIAANAAAILSKDNPSAQAEYNQKLEAIEQRLNNLSKEIHSKIAQAQLINTPVIVSKHQAVFAEWLGLDVVATFVGSDIETPTGINKCLEKAKGRDIRFVIANKQEGTELALALAQRLNAKMAVFSNFPSEQYDSAGLNCFDYLLYNNINQLIGAVQ